MHWKLHPKRFGLLSIPSSPEERKHRNTKHLPVSVDRIWKFKKGIFLPMKKTVEEINKMIMEDARWKQINE